MNCPSCNESRNAVLETRRIEGGTAIRRRRECGGCGWRFTTVERVQHQVATVLKTPTGSSARREAFQERKLRRGVELATSNLILDTTVDEIVGSVISEISMMGTTVRSTDIGEAVLRQLREISPIAYLRFSSVFRSYSTIADFDHHLTGAGSDRVVAKRDGSLEDFDRDKIRRGIEISIVKPETISPADVEMLVDRVDQALPVVGQISSEQIGEAVLEVLRTAHPAGHLRFLSVFRRWTHPDEAREGVRRAMADDRDSQADGAEGA